MLSTITAVPELVYRVHKDSLFGQVIQYILQTSDDEKSNISSSSSSSTTSSFSWTTFVSSLQYKEVYYDIGYKEIQIIKKYIDQHYTNILQRIQTFSSSSTVTVPSSLSSSSMITWLLLHQKSQTDAPSSSWSINSSNSTAIQQSTNTDDHTSSILPLNHQLRIGIIGQPSSEELHIQRNEKQLRKQLWRQEMRSRAAHTEYLSLVQDIRKDEIEASKPNEIVEYKAQMSLGISLLVVLFSGALLGYILGRAWYGQASTMPYIIAALFGGFMLMVEGCLTVTRLSKIDYIQNLKRKNTQNLVNPNVSAPKNINLPGIDLLKDTKNEFANEHIISSSNVTSTPGIRYRGDNSSGNAHTNNSEHSNVSRSDEQYENLRKLTQSLNIENKKKQ